MTLVAMADSRATKVGNRTHYGRKTLQGAATARRTGSKLAVPPADIPELTRLSRSAGVAYRLVLRSRIILSLAAGRGERLTAVAREIGVSYASLQRCQQTLGHSIFEPPPSVRGQTAGNLACSDPGDHQTKEHS